MVYTSQSPITGIAGQSNNNSNYTCSESVTTGLDSDLNETSLPRDVMAVDPVE